MSTPTHASPANTRLRRAFTAPGEPDWQEIRAAILAGANPNGPSIRRAGRTLLTYQLSRRKTSTSDVRWLLKHGANPNASDMNDETPLIVATATEQGVSTVACLLNHGAHPNTRNRHGWTPLAYAVWYAGRPTDTIALLLAHGADPNASNDVEDQTILFLAANGPAITDLAGLLGVLLDAGADPTLTDNAGRTLPQNFVNTDRQDSLEDLDVALASPARTTARRRLLGRLTDDQQKAWLPRAALAETATDITKPWTRKP